MAGRKKSMARKARKRTSSDFEPEFEQFKVPVVLSLLLLGGLTVFYVWEGIRFRELNREIVELEMAKKEVLEENARLRAQVEELSSFRRISKIAEKRFGFVVLKPRVIVVSEDE